MSLNRRSYCERETFERLLDINEAQARALAANLTIRNTITWDAAPATRNMRIWEIVRERGGLALTELDERLRDQLRMPAPAYWLYMSCSEGERNDDDCRTFFNDLTRRLQHLFPGRELRYLDEGNAENPTLWSPWSLRAMREAQVLVCLFSKAFFNSLYCGQVWRAFLTRWETENQTQPCPLIFPVMWGSPDEYPAILPVLAREVVPQYAGPGTTYAEKGLRFLLRQAKAFRGQHQAEYDALLDSFASALAQMSQHNSLPTDIDVPALSGIDSAFYQSWQDPARTVGPGYVKFIYLAGRTGELQPLRRSGAYGEEPKDWVPYHPESPLDIHSFSYDAARKADMKFDSIMLNNKFVDNIRAADDRRNITMVLVDPWTIQLAAYGELAKQYDAMELPWSTVLVCWNGSDRETGSLRAKLEAQLRRVFERKIQARNPKRWRDGIDAVAMLRSELDTALLSAKNEIVQTIEPAKVATGASFIRPQPIAQSRAPEAGVDARPAESEHHGPISQPHV